MKRFGLETRFPVTLAAVFLSSAPGMLHAQVEGLPIKPGLWETTATMSGGRVITKQACYTAKMTVDDYIAQMKQQQQGQVSCTVSNEKRTAHSFSMDQLCTGQGMTVKGHIELEMPNSETTTATNHMDMSGLAQGHPMNMSMDISYKGKFVSSDCGAVKPLVSVPPK